MGRDHARCGESAGRTYDYDTPRCRVSIRAGLVFHWDCGQAVRYTAGSEFRLGADSRGLGAGILQYLSALATADTWWVKRRPLLFPSLFLGNHLAA